MRFLGIHSFSHDTSACLVEDGKVVCAVEEERFVNIKHVRGIMNGVNTPDNAIEWILTSRGLKLNDIDIFAHTKTIFSKSSSRLDLGEHRYLEYTEQLDPGLKKTLFFDHHLCHAVSTFGPSGFDTANVMTIDGRGTSQATGLYYGAGDKITTILEIPFSHSLGEIYKTVTRLLGFGRWGEGKTMALAAFGDPIPEFQDLIELTHHGYKINHKLVQKFEKYHRFSNGPLEQKHKDLATTIQIQLENALCHLASLLYKETGERRLCLAGGTALNCVANLKLLELDFVDEIYVQPASHDAGTAIGAALEAARLSGNVIKNPMPTIYMGPQYEPDEIEDILVECGVRYTTPENLCLEVAKILERGKIIGWFQGALEFGPRALGNRSILANPCFDGIKDRVNSIKHRELWRPVAPAILASERNEYLQPAVLSPYMTLAYKVKLNNETNYTAITHSDGTARTQTVTDKDNPLFYQLIFEFKSITGIPMLINTSFNSKDMPIVRTPIDALRTYFSTGMDYLVIGPFIVTK